jgi:hypothetical protein
VFSTKQGFIQALANMNYNAHGNWYPAEVTALVKPTITERELRRIRRLTREESLCVPTKWISVSCPILGRDN